ncbi:transmembrane protein 42-like [Apostichopus japonicus]|uniref:transmembrane protein 42-like n=1 Tax=Stichopus japonicus TaxID=307972 RepID=UPI003AB8DEF3
MWTSGFVMAVSAGLCAATASVVAKFAFSSSEADRLCSFLLQLYFPNVEPTDKWTLMSPVLRIVCFLLMLSFNGVMWTMYVKSMQMIGTIQATLTNTSSNLLATAFLGWLMFGEIHSIWWFFGATLIVTGLMFMQRGSKDPISEEDHQSKKTR